MKSNLSQHFCWVWNEGSSSSSRMWTKYCFKHCHIFQRYSALGKELEKWATNLSESNSMSSVMNVTQHSHARPRPPPLMYSNAKSLLITDRIPWENTFFKWWGVSNGQGLVREVCYYQETDVFQNSLAGWGQELAGASPVIHHIPGTIFSYIPTAWTWSRAWLAASRVN